MNRHIDGLFLVDENSNAIYDNKGNLQYTKYDNEDSSIDAIFNSCGAAIYSCVETAQGHFIVSDGKCASQVNYCPWCGLKAPTQIVEKESKGLFNE